MATATLVPLYERVLSGNLDRTAAVISNVKIVGLESQNGRSYSIVALTDALDMYEGAKVYLGHKYESRSGDFNAVGVLRNVVSRRDGLYGDLHFFQEHSEYKYVIERYIKHPNGFGLSHEAIGELVRRGGKMIVDRIDRVAGVAIVELPGATSNLHESKGNRELAYHENYEDFIRSIKSDRGGFQMYQPRSRRLREDAHDLVDQATGKLSVSDFEVKVIELVRSQFTLEEKVERFRDLLAADESLSAVDMTPEQPGGEIQESYSRSLTHEQLLRELREGRGLERYPDSHDKFIQSVKSNGLCCGPTATGYRL